MNYNLQAAQAFSADVSIDVTTEGYAAVQSLTVPTVLRVTSVYISKGPTDCGHSLYDIYN